MVQHSRCKQAPATLARSHGKMERDNICSRISNILGANRRLANANSSMPQENNPDAACMYVPGIL